jgi:hypothetical protein
LDPLGILGLGEFLALGKNNLVWEIVYFGLRDYLAIIILVSGIELLCYISPAVEPITGCFVSLLSNTFGGFYNSSLY